MAARVKSKQARQNFHQNNVFRDRRNPLDEFNDDKLLHSYRLEIQIHGRCTITRVMDAYLQLKNEHVKMPRQCLHFRFHTVDSLSRSPHATFLRQFGKQI